MAQTKIKITFEQIRHTVGEPSMRITRLENAVKLSPSGGKFYYVGDIMPIDKAEEYVFSRNHTVVTVPSSKS